MIKKLLRRGWVWTIFGVSIGIPIRGVRGSSRKSGAAILHRVASSGRWNSRQICIDRAEIGISHTVISGPRHDLKCGSVRPKAANRIARFFLAVDVFSCPQYLDEFGFGQPFGQPWIGLIV